MLLILGIVCYLIGLIPGVDATMKKIMQAVVIIIALLTVLQAFGLVGESGHVGRLW